MMRRVMIILWPAFLVAIAEEGLFFSLFDPQDLAILFDYAEMSVKATYTLGFFFFWLFSTLVGMLTYFLAVFPNNRHSI